MGLSKDIKIILPEKVKYILDILHGENFEAFIVGGCVRDSILGRAPQDWDITTSALPEDVVRFFGGDRTIPTGIKYGTVTVLIDGHPFEVTTYRVDSKYSDGRRPDSVKFTSSIEEELKRRDFTINAMAYGEDRGLIDLFDGQGDIKRKVIRCVGDAHKRFGEDALRMMRAVRFASQLNFDIEHETLSSIVKNGELIEKVSRERIILELNKILLSPNPSKLRMLFSTGLMNHIIPELQEYYQSGSLNRPINAIGSAENKLCIRMAMLLGDLGDRVYDVLKRLKYDNSTINRVSTLVKHCRRPIEDDRKYLRYMLSKIGEESLKDLISIRIALSSGGSPSGTGSEPSYEDLERLQNAVEIVDDIIKSKECFEVKGLAINGRDLIRLGFKGLEVGKTLEDLIFMVIENQELNTKEKLLDIAASKR